MKFDLKPEIVNGILAIMQEAPVPHKVVDPILKELIRQSQDAKIQSLDYPPDKPPESVETE